MKLLSGEQNDLCYEYKVQYLMVFLQKNNPLFIEVSSVHEVHCTQSGTVIGHRTCIGSRYVHTSY